MDNSFLNRETFRKQIPINNPGVTPGAHLFYTMTTYNTSPTSRLLRHLSAGALALGLTATVFAQGTQFTYQGRLNDGGAASGTYDLSFALYDALANGNPAGGTVTNTATTVSNGLFTATLDFGAGVFPGANRWLEIAVRTNGGGAAYTTLSPRQALTPTPYAIFATTSGTASNVGNGSVVKSLNGLRDAVTLAAGTNMTITPNGNILTLASAGAGGSGIWSVLNNNAYYNAGKVGIGTAAPSGKLTVATSDDTAPESVFAFDARHALVGTPSAGLGLSYSASTGAGYITALAPGVAFKDLVLQASTLRFNPSGGTPALSVLSNGNVGIGSGTPAGKLEVVGQDALRLVGYNPFLTLLDSNAGYARSRIQGVGGDVDLFTESYLSGANPFSFLKVANNGNVGIGSSLPVGKLEVVAQDALRLVGYNPFLTFLDSNAGYARSRIQGVGGEMVLMPESYLNGSDGNAYVKLANSGNLSVKSLTVRGGADVAEPFQMSTKEIPKGAVVVIDEENAGQLKLSHRAYDSRVAGIVSGANGINPGIALHQDGALDGGQNVALSGRVYVLADASSGAIRPGDLLTTSDTPGHAMKVTDHGRASGAILGKAMSALKEGQGMVLVLVTLQ